MESLRASGLQIEISQLCSNSYTVTVSEMGADRFPYTVVTPGYSCAELEEWFTNMQDRDRVYFVFTGTYANGINEVYSQYRVANRRHALYAQIMFGGDVPLSVLKFLR
jgi:hypothetical protein